MRPVDGVTLIAAVSENGVIGKDGNLPWNIPSDLRRFRDLTLRKVVVMGRRTAKSLGTPLQGRFNIVISRSGEIGFRADMRYNPQVELVRSAREAVSVAFEKTKEWGKDEFFVIGGAEVYKAMMPYATKILLSRVHADVAGDAFFPPIPSDFRRIGGLFCKREKGDDYDVTFETWRRRP